MPSSFWRVGNERLLNFVALEILAYWVVCIASPPHTSSSIPPFPASRLQAVELFDSWLMYW